MCTDVSQPFVRRSDQRKARKGIIDFSEIYSITPCPYGGSVVRVASVGAAIDFEPLRHVVHIVFEEVAEH